MRRPLVPPLAALSVVALALPGCGSASVHELPPAAEPARSPPLTERPAGRVVPVGTAPEGVVADGRTGAVAVALRDPARLAILDAATGRVRTEVPLPGDGGPRHLQLDGSVVLTPAEPADRLARIRLPSGRVLSTTPVGHYPHDVTVAGPPGRIFVGDERGGDVTVLDGGRRIGRFPVAAQPGGLAPARSGGSVAVVSVRERVLETYDARTFRRTGRTGAGVGPTHVVTDGHQRAWVTDTQGGALLVYGLAPKVELERRVYLPGSPYGIAVDHRRHRLWVTLTATNELVELPATGRPYVLRRLPTVRQPDTVAVDEATGRVFVTGKVAGVLELVDP